MTYDALPFSGIATFFKAPLVAAPTTADADVAVVGIGWDEGTTSRSGARMGPRALREASTMYAFQRDAEPFWDGEAGVELLGGVRWADCGDVALGPMWSPERYHNAVVDKLQPIMKSGLFPVTLGGDHSIGYPVLKALYQSRGGKPVHLVQFDTHMDYWDEEGGSRFSHASPIIRSHEAGFLAEPHAVRHPQPAHRPATTSPWRRAAGRTSSGASRRRTCSWTTSSSTCPRARDVYITFDIDALDPAIAPGTGTPEPGGFTLLRGQGHPARRLRPLQRRGHGPRRGRAAVRRPRPGDGAARRPPDPRHRGSRVPPPRGARVSAAPGGRALTTGRRRAAGPPRVECRQYSSFRPEPPIAALMAEAGTRPLRVTAGCRPARRQPCDGASLGRQRSPGQPAHARRRTPLPPRRPRGADVGGAYAASSPQADAERRYQLLLETSVELASSLDLDEVLQSAARRLGSALDIPDCDFYRLDGDDRLVCVASSTKGRFDGVWTRPRVLPARMGLRAPGDRGAPRGRLRQRSTTRAWPRTSAPRRSPTASAASSSSRSSPTTR